MDSPAGATCPFNRLDYARSLRHVGAAQAHPVRPLVLLRRPIGTTGRHDGISPWPYLWLEDGDVDALRSHFDDLVAIPVVAQPGYVPPAGVDHVLLKHHFVYDPALPTPPLSPRAHRRLEACARRACFERVVDREARMAIAGLYAGLAARRGLVGGFFDMGADHFAVLADLTDSVFVRVRAGERVGAMACGVVFGGMLQILHTVPSQDGLTWNASYLLMHGLQAMARAEGLRLFLGGLPDGAAAGLDVFKSRWTNARVPVHLIRIVNDPAAYAALAGTAATRGYFPAYRDPKP
ncbi:hypothetical protein [Aquabacter spiritensis]|uniref:hypothetical protein n=1 Tax=Aquabacter spiritensis TaxID=933073 RepID=UPI00104AE2EE|nr:hypothetical protein [Aquabacter spiritensis]